MALGVPLRIFSIDENMEFYGTGLGTYTGVVIGFAKYLETRVTPGESPDFRSKDSCSIVFQLSTPAGWRSAELYDAGGGCTV